MRFYLDRMKVLGTPGHQATPWGVSCLCWFTRRSRHLSLITLSHRHWPWMAHNYPSLWTSIRDLFLNCGPFLNDSEFSYHHGKRSTGRFCQTSKCKSDLENAQPFERLHTFLIPSCLFLVPGVCHSLPASQGASSNQDDRLICMAQPSVRYTNEYVVGSY